jgi:hypothetical protein
VSAEERYVLAVLANPSPCSADATHKFNLKDYFGTMKVMGRFHNVGLGDHPLPEIMAQDFAGNGTCRRNIDLTPGDNC